jgi:hypothetical protein
MVDILEQDHEVSVQSSTLVGVIGVIIGHVLPDEKNIKAKGVGEHYVEVHGSEPRWESNNSHDA